MRPKMNARKAFCRGFLHIDGVLLRKEREARTSPFPGRTHPIGSVSIVTLTRACWKRWRFCVVAAHEHDRQLQAPPFATRETIAHAVWLYVRFNLSLREFEEMLINVALMFPTKRSGVGWRNSPRRSPETCAGGRRLRGTFGISTKLW